MSEISNHIEIRRKALLAFCCGMIEGGKGIDLINEYQTFIEKVTPEDTVVVVDWLMNKGYSIEAIKANIGKILNVFYKYLVLHVRKKLTKNHFLYYMILENYHLKDKLNKMRPYIQAINKKNGIQDIQAIDIVRKELKELQKFEIHYQKKENIFFPYFESHFPEYKCLSVMWSIHDDIRKHFKDLDEILMAVNLDLKKFNKSIADLFFAMHAIIFREDFILYPVALKYVPEKAWAKMHKQSFEIGFVFIEPPIPIQDVSEIGTLKDGFVDMETGKLSVEQLVQLMNHLPFDMTFVDHNDEVAYFSNPKDRFFTRSKAIIGRKVNNCHPPESVHQVQ